jgi:nitrogen-specific signal transduction histidine kinase/CheY-like chemotaxis protein
VIHDRSAQIAADEARKEAESLLREAQKLESIGTLAGGIAHDFNNILAAIVGCTALIEAELPRDSAARDDLQTLQRAAHRGRDIVQQILSFSRRQLKQPMAIRPAARLLLDVAALLRSTIPAGIDIAVETGPDPLHVSVNEGQMHQVLLNLGVNAWHAVPAPGGHIKFSMQGCRVDGLPAAAGVILPPGDYVRLDVADDGTGMTAAVRERIFEPFFTTKPVGAGTGLGLAVAHGIVLDHRGKISVDSTPGRGTTFHVWLPLAPAPAAPAEDSGFATLDATEGNERIVVVDDDEFVRSVLQRILLKKGYHVTCFDSSDAALQAIRKDPASVDLVLTDYNMPDRSGLDLARELADLRPDLPVIISSGLVDDELQQRAVAAGAARVLAKERVEELGPALRSVLDARKGRRG